MANNTTEEEQALPCSFLVKVDVHNLMCNELKKVIDMITKIIPALESARPGCMSGIQALCALNISIDKAKFLFQNCAESSKLYLAIRGESIKIRFERVSRELDISLSKIQDMVPQPLAAEIIIIVNDLRDAKFVVESSEEEAGRVLIALLELDTLAAESREISEPEAFQLAAQRLKIVSPKDLLIEKRCIRKQLDKVGDTDMGKKSILKTLLHLLRKYGASLQCVPVENVKGQYKGSISSADSASKISPCLDPVEPVESKTNADSACNGTQTDASSPDVPPKELRCPISSKLMFDPVVVASDVTYERVWIEKWFNDGHDTCPKTQKKLPHLSLTPNSFVKDLISDWCKNHNLAIPYPCSQPIPSAFTSLDTSSSIYVPSSSDSLHNIRKSNAGNMLVSSPATSNCLDPLYSKAIERLKDVYQQIFSQNKSDGCPSFADFSHQMYSNFLSGLLILPSELQAKAVEGIELFLKDNEEACFSMKSNGFVEALMGFLIKACNQADIKAQKLGAQILLAFVNKFRYQRPFLQEDAFPLLTSFLNSEMCEEALAIMQVLSSDKYYKSKIAESGALPFIVKLLDSQCKEFVVQAVKILCDLSSYGDGFHILSSECITKLIPLLGDDECAGICTRILLNLCDTEEGRIVITESNGGIASIVKLLDAGTYDQQEYAVLVLLKLCSQCSNYCQLVMDEGLILPLVNLSINGSESGKQKARKLLLLLRDVKHNYPPDRYTVPECIRV